MGEIGIDRRTFYYDLEWWEVKAIIKGYNNRHHAGWEQARLVAYNARFCMGVPKGQVAPTVMEWMKFPWEEMLHAPMSDETVKKLQAELSAINAESSFRDSERRAIEDAFY